MNCLGHSHRSSSLGRAVALLLGVGIIATMLATAEPASAQVTSGKLTGVITDAETGEPLVGAQVYLEGTGLGALTGENGRYFIVNVPPATYTVVVEMLGYQTVRTENVVVVIDATRNLSVQLTPQAIAVEEIRVEVERTPLVEVQARGSQDLISSDELANLPVRSVEEALELKQGFYVVPDNENILAFTEKSRGITPIRIRGGRNGETVTLIDGIPINNFIFGGPAFSLTRAAVGQITFMKGGFPPKYGNALSGIINIATKSPGTELRGAFEYQTSRVAGALGSTPDDLNELDFLEGDVSGPIPGTGDKLRFLVAGRKQSSAARVLEFDDDVFDPTNPPAGLNTPLVRDVFPGWRAFGFDDESQIYAKLEYHLTPTSKLSASIIDERRQFQRFDFDYLLAGFDAQSSPVIDTRADSLFVANSNFENVVLGSVEADRTLFVGQYNQVLGRTFFNVSFGIFDQKRLNCNFFEGVCLGNSFSDKNFIEQFVAPGITVKHPTAGTDDLYGGEDITTYVLRADVQSQVTDHHNLGFGAFADFHDLSFDEDQQLGTNDLFVVKLKYDAKPWDAAFYVQDVIEYDFLNLDLGMRVDIGKAGGLFFADPLDPTNGTTAREVCQNPGEFAATVDPVTGELIEPDPAWTLESCSDPGVRAEAAIIATQDDFEESSTRVQFSPRLGVSFPVTTSTNVFFNYAVNTQNPTLNNIYQNTSIGQDPGEALPCGLRGVPRDAAQKATCGPIIFSDQFAVSFLGNPNLEIERTSTYEVGLLSELGTDWALSVVLFNKDQTGLTGVGRGGIGVQDIGATHGTSSLNYLVLVNEDFQTVKGIEVGVRKRLTDFWGLDVNYAYSQARTNAAPPERERQSLASEADPTLRREIRSEIDIPHRFNGVVRFAAGEEVPDIPGGGILKHSNLALTLQAQSGIPYTPTTTFRGGTGTAVGNSLFQLERYSGRGPAAWWVDLRAQKGFMIGNLIYSAFLQVNNLFDRKNCFQPLATTGRCDFGARDQDRARQGNPLTEAASSTNFDRPYLYGPRRQIVFGLRVDF
jgi:outer membrane receptor protein involved in Fe transport